MQKRIENLHILNMAIIYKAIFSLDKQILFIKLTESFAFGRLVIFWDFCWGIANADVDDEEFVEDEDADVKATIIDGCCISFAATDGADASRVGVKVSVAWVVWLFLKLDV